MSTFAPLTTVGVRPSDLRVLYLGRNELTSIPADLFKVCHAAPRRAPLLDGPVSHAMRTSQYNPLLRFVTLNNNKLTTVPDGVFKTTTFLHGVKLHSAWSR